MAGILRIGPTSDAELKLPISSIVVASVLLFGWCEPSWSQEKIGGAQAVINNVQGKLPSGNQAPVVQGDSVFLDETISSGADSKANLVLDDNSDVTIGPGSTVMLDDFVYSGAKQPGMVAVSLSNGTLRYITGDANKRAYTIWTPTAAIGIRGASLRLKATPTETNVITEEGTAIVCLRKPNEYAPVEEIRKPCRGSEEQQANLIEGKNLSCPCTALLLPGEQATITLGEIAVAAAPQHAVSEPFIGPSKDFSVLAADLPTKKAPLAPIVAPPPAGPPLWVFPVAGLLGAGAIAGIIAATQSSPRPPTVFITSFP
jgi:FecR protein